MAGRTERVNARDLVDRAEGIFFEADTARGWLEQLERRVNGALRAAEGNRLFEGEWHGVYEELNEASSALTDALSKLRVFEVAVARREGKSV